MADNRKELTMVLQDIDDAETEAEAAAAIMQADLSDKQKAFALDRLGEKFG